MLGESSRGTGPTQQVGELGQQAHLDHLAAQAGVEGQVEQQPQGDVQQVLLIAGDQPGKLRHRVDLSLPMTGNSRQPAMPCIFHRIRSTFMIQVQV